MKRIFAAVLLSAVLTMTSCRVPQFNWRIGKNILISDGTHEMTESQVRLIALQYKTEYDRYYSGLLGEGFWKESVGNGADYERFILEYCVFHECKALFYLNGMAQRDGLSLSILDKEAVKNAADAVYEAMSEDEKEYTGAVLKDIEEVLSYYYLADLELEKLTGSERIEISDEESRVADIQVICLKDEKNAKEVLRKIAGGDNFLSTAKENTEGKEIAYSVARGELSEKLEETVFRMSENEISDIIESGGNYYIVRMVSTYNSILSENNKKNMQAALKYETWQAEYEKYSEEPKIRRNEKSWQSIRLDLKGDYPEINLFRAF